MKNQLLVILIILFSSSVFAQSTGGWLIYFGTSTLKDSNWSIHHEIQLRDHQILGDHNQTLARVGFQYKLKPYLQGTVGYGFIHTELEDSPNRPFSEHRIYQEAILSHNLSVAKLRHRFRLEERFIENQDFRGRLRYCLFLDLPFSEKGMKQGGTYLALYDEVFLNLSDQEQIKFFDRNRLYAGLGWKVQDRLGLQLGYMRQHIGKQAGRDHILASVHHTIKW